MRRSLCPCLFALVAVGAVAGCSAKLPEGVFGCMMSSECPAGWYCWSNRTCHSTPERDGGPDTGLPPVDGGGGGGRNPTCAPPCMGSTCAVGQFVMGMPTAGCISNPAPAGHGNPCTSIMQCTAPDACIPMASGHCLRPCDPGMYDNGGCGFGEDCVMLAGAPVCLRPCTGAGSCAPPFTCVSGHCTP